MEEINILIGVLIGIIRWFSVLRRFNIKYLVKEELIFILERSEYSYSQYHWYPMVLIEMFDLKFSSIIYKVFKEGMAIKISMIAGRDVQNNSIC